MSGGGSSCASGTSEVADEEHGSVIMGVVPVPVSVLLFPSPRRGWFNNNNPAEPNSWGLIPINNPRGAVAAMPSPFPGNMAMVSKTFSLGFHLRGESLLPLGDIGESIEVVAVVVVELPFPPHEKARLSKGED